MKITLIRGELKIMTQGFAKIIPNRSTVAILGCVRFHIEGGDLTAAATDLDQTLVFRFDCAEAEGAGDIIAPFTLLRDLSKGAGAETVTLEDEGGDITVTNNVGGHAVTTTAVGADPKDWPESGPEIPVQEALGFLQAYRRIAPFASVDETRRTLQSVHIDVSGAGDHNATLVATDGRRLCCCNSLKLPVTDKDGVMVPVSKFLLWNGLQGEVMLGVSKSKECTRIGVSAGRWTYRVKAVDGVYPNWRQVIPCADGLAHTLRFSEPDVEALRKLVPALPGTEAVALEGGNGGVSLCAADKESAKTVTVPLTAGSTYTGPGCRVIVNRHYLMDAVNAGFRNFMFAESGASPLVSDDGKGGTHVLMPLRMDGPANPEPQPEPQPELADEEAEQIETETPAQAQEPAQTPQPAPQQETEMTNETHSGVTPAQQTALERLQAAYATAKASVREAQSALSDVAAAIRDAVKEDRQRRLEVETVRAGLAKLQSIKV